MTYSGTSKANRSAASSGATARRKRRQAPKGAGPSSDVTTARSDGPAGLPGHVPRVLAESEGGGRPVLPRIRGGRRA